jgi:hypothetical protein
MVAMVISFGNLSIQTAKMATANFLTDARQSEQLAPLCCRSD